MKSIFLNPKEISKILNVDLDTVVNSIISQKKIKVRGTTEEVIKEKKRIARQYFDVSEIKIMQQSHLVGMENVDLLDLTIRQSNQHWREIMYKACHNDQCIKKIGFKANLTYFDKILETEVVETILKKLYEYHFQIYGNKTKEYKEFQLIYPNIANRV